MRGPRSIVPVLPTLLTLGNLGSGFVAMAKTIDALQASGGTGPLDPAFGAKIVQAVLFVLLAMIFDALDGRIARLTGQTSAFGAQLDSLADVVTFGVAPALMAKVVYEHTRSGLVDPFHAKVTTLLCALYLIGAVLRLARFTVKTDADEESHQTFEGLPSPAAAAVIVTTCLFVFEGRGEIWLPAGWADALAVTLLRGLPITACLLGLLMVSRLPYVHVAQRYVGHRTRATTLINLVVLGWLVVLFHEWFLYLVALTYVLGGLVLAVRSRITGRPVLADLPPPWSADGEDDEDGPTPPTGVTTNGSDRLGRP